MRSLWVRLAISLLVACDGVATVAEDAPRAQVAQVAGAAGEGPSGGSAAALTGGTGSGGVAEISIAGNAGASGSPAVGGSTAALPTAGAAGAPIGGAATAGGRGVCQCLTGRGEICGARCTTFAECKILDDTYYEYLGTTGWVEEPTCGVCGGPERQDTPCGF